MLLNVHWKFQYACTFALHLYCHHYFLLRYKQHDVHLFGHRQRACGNCAAFFHLWWKGCASSSLQTTFKIRRLAPFIISLRIIYTCYSLCVLDLVRLTLLLCHYQWHNDTCNTKRRLQALSGNIRTMSVHIKTKSKLHVIKLFHHLEVTRAMISLLSSPYTAKGWEVQSFPNRITNPSKLHSIVLNNWIHFFQKMESLLNVNFSVNWINSLITVAMWITCTNSQPFVHLGCSKYKMQVTINANMAITMM